MCLSVVVSGMAFWSVTPCNLVAVGASYQSVLRHMSDVAILTQTVRTQFVCRLVLYSQSVSQSVSHNAVCDSSTLSHIKPVALNHR
jgi:hypothetical protein